MDSVMNMIYNERQRTNHNYVYSCLNFCLLRQAEENVTGVRHDRYVYDNIFHRIGAFRTVYRPLDFFPEKKSQRQSSTSISAKDISAALSTTRQRHSPAAYKEMPDSSPTPTILPNCARCGCLEECMAASASSRSLLSTRS